MSKFTLDRRAFLAATGGALASAPLLGPSALASGSVIAAIYPGTWEEAFRQIVAPAVMEAHGIEVEFDPSYAVDQIAKARAARGLPPFDTFVLDPGPAATGAEMGLYQPIDMAKLTNADKLPEVFVTETAVPVAAQVVGIAYNPTKFDAPPTGWAQLFEEPYVSSLGLTGFQTTFGTTSLIEIAKAFGGSISDIDPAMEKIKQALPKIAAVAQPSAMAGLFQQGQINLMYTNTQTVANAQGPRRRHRVRRARDRRHRLRDDDAHRRGRRERRQRARLHRHGDLRRGAGQAHAGAVQLHPRQRGRRASRHAAHGLAR